MHACFKTFRLPISWTRRSENTINKLDQKNAYTNIIYTYYRVLLHQACPSYFSSDDEFNLIQIIGPLKYYI